MVATEQSGEKEASTLRQEHAALQEQNRLLQTEVISLRQQAHYHRTQHQRAVQRAQELEAQVGVLKAKVAGLQQRLFGRKSERVSRASPSGAAGEESGIGRRARGQQPGSAGHGRKLRKNLPVVETLLDLCEQQKRCPRFRAAARRGKTSVPLTPANRSNGKCASFDVGPFGPSIVVPPAAIASRSVRTLFRRLLRRL